ncbi:MAG: HD domain-containing protein, partial [Nitrososphaerales archaeon]
MTLLTRLCALLHDLAHIPFGHTLEDEGKLFPSQWKDKKRIKIFLGDNSEIGKIIVNYINRSTLKRIRDILTAEDEEEIQELQYPIVADIVGNTICADLLDYLARDLYYSGIRGTYDERFLDYLIVQKLDGSEKQRLAITLFKPVKGDYRRDVVSELLHLLRLRYTLAE